METFVTSDTHFWHKNILKYQPEERPFASAKLKLFISLKMMGEKLEPDENREFKDLMKSAITEHNETIIERWNKMIAKDDVVYHLGDFAFASVPQVIEILDRLNGKIHFLRGNHDKPMSHPDVQSRLASIQDYKLLKGFAKHPIVMFHNPIHCWDRMQYGAYHFYGHTHGQIPFLYHGLAMDVGMDTNNLNPYNVPELVEKLDKIVETMGESAIVDARNRSEK